MTEPSSLSPIESLVLARLLLAGEKGAKAADLKKDLEPLLGHRWSGGELTAVLERTVIKLVSLALAAYQPVKSKKAAPAVALTDERPPDRTRLPEGRSASHQAETNVGQPQEIAASGPRAGACRAGWSACQGRQAERGSAQDPVRFIARRIPQCEAGQGGVDAQGTRHGGTRKGDSRYGPGGSLPPRVGRRSPHRAQEGARPVAGQKAPARGVTTPRSCAMRSFATGSTRAWASGRWKLPSRAIPPQPPRPRLHRWTWPVRSHGSGGGPRCQSGRYGDNKVFIVHVWTSTPA